MDVTRRHALRASGGALATGLAGCLGGSSGPDLAFSASVLQQQSESGPASVEATLSNDGSSDVEVGFGPALLFSDDGPSDDHDWAKELILDPRTLVGPSIQSERTDEGCWRAPDDRDRPIQSSLEFREIPSGESIQETYDVYTWTEASACLPEGSYRFQDDCNVGEESRTTTLTLVLEVDADGRLTATGERSTIETESTPRTGTQVPEATMVEQ